MSHRWSKESETLGRRPIKTRNNKLAQAFAAWLSRKTITPNQISLLSMVFAFLAGGCIFFSANAKYIGAWWLSLLAAVCIQGRLLCNLFDGLVAVEGGKKTRSGELYNDIPDRFSDLFIIVPVGYALPWGCLSIALGWFAGTLAVMTAYVRTLNASLGVPVDFRGPMAKPHRMALLTVGCIVSAIETVYWPHRYALLLVLILLIIGSIVTVIRRILFGYRFLEGDSHG